MPNRFYVDNYDQLTQKERNKLRQRFVCAECREWINYWKDDDGKVYLACHLHDRNQHEGVAKEFTPPNEQQLLGRRESEMAETALTQHQQFQVLGIPLKGALSQEQATKVLQTIWKGAPAIEVFKAATICADFGLHPLMNHVYLIKYKGKQGDIWSTVMGIGATRLLMARQGSFSYLDDTPRIMSEEEQKRIFGKVDANNIVAITKLKTKDGLEAQGYGKYPKTGGYLMGEDKGNSRENMAFIRSERNAFGRLFPDAEQPRVEVIDERYMALPDNEQVNTETGEITSEEGPGEEIIEGKVIEPEGEEQEPVKPEPKDEKPKKQPAKKQEGPKQELPLQTLARVIKETKVNDNGTERNYTWPELQTHMKNTYGKERSADLTEEEITMFISNIKNYQVGTIAQEKMI